MNRLSIASFCCLLVLTATGFTWRNPPSRMGDAQTSLAAIDDYDRVVRPFLQTHCLRCHGSQNAKGGLNLRALSGETPSFAELDHWEAVLDALESEEMPPSDETQPDPTQRLRVTRWIQDFLSHSLEQGEQPPQASIVRRLSNFEYQNTLVDLIGIDLEVIDELPQDPAKPYQFNNTAEFMLLGPEQIDRYLEVARHVMASAIVDPEKPEIHQVRRDWDSTDSNPGFAKPLKQNEIPIHNARRGTPGQGMGIKSFPRRGEFRIRFQASAVFPNGETELPLRWVMGYNLNINSSTQLVAEVGTVHLKNDARDPQVYELRGRIENFPVQKGIMHKGKQRPDTLTITPQNIYDDGTLNDENNFLYWPRQPDMPRAVVDWIEFEAPVVDVWPPAHHSEILFESPLREESPREYVRQVLIRFMSRAYRRPATVDEVDRFVKVYDLLQPDLGSLEATIRETLAMVLVTPQFLLHTKADGDRVTKDHEIASRLSYFLWGSMPDQTLLEMANQGLLQDPEILGAQVQRLLADPRSKQFVANFTRQWLSLEKLKTVPINRDLFPRFLYYVEAGERAGTEKPYIPTIRDYMIEETVSFVAELIRRNASVSQLVDSDFAMLNQPLAAHYGVPGIEGQRIRPVPLVGEHHLGGLLTHGSVLIANSTGSAPHPIYRAVWLREAILGDPVQPPPADVPALSDSVGASVDQASNIKELLAQHRSKTSCQNCHVNLDPWGIPFERYNAIGKYQPLVPKAGTRIRGFHREQDSDLVGYTEYLESLNTEVVLAESTVPRGPQINGMKELKAYLLVSRMDDIVENVAQRLLTYGLGRKLTYRDRIEIANILAESEAKDFLLRDLIVRICQSSAFGGTER